MSSGQLKDEWGGLAEALDVLWDGDIGEPRCTCWRISGAKREGGVYLQERAWPTSCDDVRAADVQLQERTEANALV